MRRIDIFGKAAVFDHIGVAVQSIGDTLGGRAGIVSEKTQRVLVAFISMNGIRVELIEPFGKSSPVALGLKKGQRLVHICFRVPDLDIAVKKGRENGFHCISKPVSASAFKGRKIIWLFSRVYGLVELVGG
jgi:hypothetical protein